MSKSKYLETLFVALEQNTVFSITLPSPHHANIVRAGLYRARASAKARSENKSSPFDRFVIGVKDNTVIIDPNPPATITPTELENITILPRESAPSHGGPRKNKPD